MTLFIDVHVLQTVPPSNLNRDDTGSPKTATYGGVRRARVSSQAWKRAARRDFAGLLDRSQLGTRTKRAAELLAKRIDERASEKVDSGKLAEAVLEKAGLKVKAARNAKVGDSPLTEYLVFFSNSQLDRLADIALASVGGAIDTRAAKDALKQDHSIDVALFGRMVANDADLNVDAACQVAHALSTHAVATEYDYYTAVDDENTAEETGAGMIGTIEFDSATLYRYATVNVDMLAKNLGDAAATARATEAFVRSFVMSMPTGKQNTFANRTTPDGVVVMVREDHPVNLVGAFEDAVRAGSGDSTPGASGFVAGSCVALANYAQEVDGAFGNAPTQTWVTRAGERTRGLVKLGDEVSLDELVRQVGARVEAAAGQP